MSQFRNSVFHHLSNGRTDFDDLSFNERKRLGGLYFQSCGIQIRNEYIEIALDSIKNFPNIFETVGKLGEALLLDKEEEKLSYEIKNSLQTEFMLCLLDAMETSIQKVFDRLGAVLTIDEREQEQDQHSNDEQEWTDDDNRMRASDMNAEHNQISAQQHQINTITDIFK